MSCLAMGAIVEKRFLSRQCLSDKFVLMDYHRGKTGSQAGGVQSVADIPIKLARRKVAIEYEEDLIFTHAKSGQVAEQGRDRDQAQGVGFQNDKDGLRYPNPLLE